MGIYLVVYSDNDNLKICVQPETWNITLLGLWSNISKLNPSGIIFVLSSYN